MFTSTDVFLVLGRRGCGKSHLARKIQSVYPRQVIFDTLGEYSDSDGIITHTFEEFTAEILRTGNSESFKIIYQFDIESENHAAEFNEALRILYYRGSILITIEECQQFSNPHSMPMWLRNCLLTGRHRRLAILFTTQRPGECHKTIASQCSNVFCGSLHEKNDIEWIRCLLGDRAFELNSLPERRFLYFRPGREIIEIGNELT